MKIFLARWRALLGVVAGIGFLIGSTQAGGQEPRTGYCGENGGLHVFTLGAGSDIGGYSHGPEAGECSELHPSIHQN